jgi:preprotein translocase subunit SecY
LVLRLTSFCQRLPRLLAMMGGTMFAIWMGELITEDGIGQGISLIIFGGIVAQILPNIAGMFSMSDDVTARIFHLCRLHR